MAATHRARAAIEAWLDSSGASELYPLWPERQIVQLIEEDLADIAAPIPTRLAAQGASPLSPGRVLGALYVLEGSAIGARVIGQRAAALGMGPGFGARHLAHQAAQPGAWPAFLHLLENAALTDAEEEVCVRQAVATFDLFMTQYSAAA